MKYIFFGTPRFAAIILKRLIAAGMSPLAVVCNPDRPTGRKGVITPPPVKELIRAQGVGGGVDILQPETLKDADLIATLKSYNADVFILAAYGKIVPKEIFSIPPRGIIVVHPSLLPKYRGATPIQSAILDGADTTGTTLLVMDEQVDHGPIIAQREFENQEARSMNQETLTDALAELSADLLLETLPRYLAGEIAPREQDHAAATYTKKFTTDDGRVNLAADDPALTERKIRALNPEPGVWMIGPPAGGGKRVKLLDAELTDGKLVLKKIQMEGGTPTTHIPPEMDHR